MKGGWCGPFGDAVLDCVWNYRPVRNWASAVLVHSLPVEMFVPRSSGEARGLFILQVHVGRGQSIREIFFVCL